MFDCFFGWRKASKCKSYIKGVQSRLKLLKTKRQAIVKQLRDDVAQLINIGYQDLAFKRAEHLFNDETVIELYELLESFCEFIISHLSYIRRNKDCPNDINEAVSSLIFASARCGDIPELRAVRKLFTERYGQKFVTTALELLPGNLVNLQVKEKLSIESVPDDRKHKLLEEIAKDQCVEPEILAIEFESELHHQIAGSCKPENPDPEPHQDDTISTTISSSVFEIFEQCSSDVMESLVNSFKAAKESQMTGRGRISNSDRRTEASSSESLPQLPDEMIVYLDDIEEVKHCTERDGTFQDQRIFKFKSPVKLQKETKGVHKDSFNANYDSWSDSDSSGNREVKAAARRRTKRRTISRENLSVKDIHCVNYYEKPCKNTGKRRKHPNSQRRTEQDITGESDTEMELYKQSTKTDKKISDSHSHTAPSDSNSKTKDPYLRAMTMPQERSEEIHLDNVQRSVSFPVASPNHVHPKLPDYDEISAKFMALKREHMQKKHN